MTNKEASYLLANADRTNFDEFMNEALDMAIKALEHEPCEDCISRADAIANIRILYPDIPVVDIMGARHKWSEKYQQYRDCEKILADLPSIQPNPKTGHWILQPSNKEQGERDFIWWKCSECGQVIYSETEQDRREYHAYCGRCEDVTDRFRK